ncbi:MAG TPA: T9SS type A sorting domain-containing protein, partial [Verrucomicrobiae bacterium]|nr:T9SS type A sorting domain-containing protein [Verrucomicrobiae bacterium]
STPVPITAASISGYFSNQQFENQYKGRAVLTGCDFASPSSNRSPVSVRSTSGDYIKIRNSFITEWQTTGVLLESNGGADTADLGSVANPADSGFNTISSTSGASGWKYIKDNDYCSGCGTPTIKAEWNCYNIDIPQSSRFSPNVDYNPYDNGCCTWCRLAVGEEENEITVNRPTELLQNYPNPFNPTTLIQFNLEKPERVNLEIFNILGQKVRTILAGEEFSAGPYAFLWDGKDEKGRGLSSGAYFYRLSTPTYSKTHKMMLVK